MLVKIVDAMCGMGKTSAAINMINKSDDDLHYLYITPYLDEVERVINACPKKHFIQPRNYGGKLNDIKRLFNRGRNIVSTHALFNMFDDEVIDIVKAHGYTLIMDEVANIVQPVEISRFDLNTILKDYTEVVNGHLLKWIVDDYKGDFEQYKRLCNLDAVYYYNETALLWIFPVKTFNAFDDIYILTYLFDAQIQRCYYDFHHLEYQYLYVSGDSLSTYEFTDNAVQYNYVDYNSLIHILDNDKMNRIGELDRSLSKTWYARNQNNCCMEEIKNNLSNYFRRTVHTPSSQNIWTTYKDYQKSLSGGGYAKGFLSCNARATNAYRNCVSSAYTINRYLHPVVKNFFIENGVPVKEDKYALSELIQWVFRTAIRDGNSINIYIPSKRMRTLFKEWLVSYGLSETVLE